MEIAIITKAKQGYIYKYMMQNNISAAELGRRIGISPSHMGQIINFQWLPPQKRKMVGGVVDRLEAYFKIPIEMLFPPELTKEITEKLKLPHIDFREVDCLQIETVNQKFLSYDPQQKDPFSEMVDFIPMALGTLTPREETCLRLRFGIRG